MLEIIDKGGIFMYPILVSSIISIAVIVERFFTCNKKQIIPDELYTKLVSLFKKHDIKEVKTVLRKSKSTLANLTYLIVDNPDRTDIKTLIDENGKRYLEKISMPLQILSTISSIAPLLGLLGTVTGMIKVFSVLSSQGLANPESLALGISEALLTTVGGLVVAIFSFVFYKYFQSKLNSIFLSLEEKIFYILDLHTNKVKE